MTEYALSIQNEKTALSGGKTRLDMWVSLSQGFEDPGVFLLHRRRSLVNKDAPPLFETVANPCTLVEYPYMFVERNYGLYRDRAVSLVFDDRDEMSSFLSVVEEKRARLVNLMNGMDADLEASPVETVAEVSIRKSDKERGFMMIDFHAASGLPFVFREERMFSRFVGVAGDMDPIPDGVRKNDLRVITYSTRAGLFMDLIRESLAQAYRQPGA